MSLFTDAKNAIEMGKSYGNSDWYGEFAHLMLKEGI